MTLERSTVYHDHLAYKWVFNKAIQISHCISMTFLHKFGTKDLSDSTILDKYTIRLHKLLVP